MQRFESVLPEPLGTKLQRLEADRGGDFRVNIRLRRRRCYLTRLALARRVKMSPLESALPEPLGTKLQRLEADRGRD